MNKYLKLKQVSYQHFLTSNNTDCPWRFVYVEGLGDEKKSATDNVKAQRESITEAYDLVRGELDNFNGDVLSSVKKAAKKKKAYRQKSGIDIPVEIYAGRTGADKKVYVTYNEKGKPIRFKFNKSASSPSVLLEKGDDDGRRQKYFVLVEGETYKVSSKQDRNGSFKKATVKGVQNNRLRKKTGYKEKFNKYGQIDGMGSTFSDRITDKNNKSALAENKTETSLVQTSALDLANAASASRYAAWQKQMQQAQFQQGNYPPHAHSHSQVNTRQYCTAQRNAAISNYQSFRNTPSNSHQISNYTGATAAQLLARIAAENITEDKNIENMLSTAEADKIWDSAILNSFKRYINGTIGKNQIIGDAKDEYSLVTNSDAEKFLIRNGNTEGVDQRLNRKINQMAGAIAKSYQLSNGDKNILKNEISSWLSSYESNSSLNIIIDEICNYKWPAGAVTSKLSNDFRLNLPAGAVTGELKDNAKVPDKDNPTTPPAKPVITPPVESDHGKPHEITNETTEQQKWDDVITEFKTITPNAADQTKVSELARSSKSKPDFDTKLVESVQESFLNLSESKQQAIKTTVADKARSDKNFEYINQRIFGKPILGDYTTNPSERVAFSEETVTKLLTKNDKNLATVVNKVDESLIQSVTKSNTKKPTTQVTRVDIERDFPQIKEQQKETIQNYQPAVKNYQPNTADLKKLSEIRSKSPDDYAKKVIAEVNKAQNGFSAEFVTKAKQNKQNFKNDIKQAYKNDVRTKTVDLSENDKETFFALETVQKKFGANTDDLVKIVKAKEEDGNFVENVEQKFKDGEFSFTFTERVENDPNSLTKVIKAAEDKIHFEFIEQRTENNEPLIEYVGEKEADELHVVEIVKPEVDGSFTTVEGLKEEEREELRLIEEEKEGGEEYIREEKQREYDEQLDEEEGQYNDEKLDDEDGEEEEEELDDEDEIIDNRTDRNIEVSEGGTKYRYEWKKITTNGEIIKNYDYERSGSLDITTKSKTITTVVPGEQSKLIASKNVAKWCKECGKDVNNATMEGIVKQLLKAHPEANFNALTIPVRYYNHSSYSKQLIRTKKYLDRLKGKSGYKICAKSCGEQIIKEPYDLENKVPLENLEKDCNDLQYIEGTGVKNFDLILPGQKIYLEKYNGNQYRIVVSASGYKGCAGKSTTTTKTVTVADKIIYKHGDWKKTGGGTIQHSTELASIPKQRKLTENYLENFVNNNWSSLKNKYPDKTKDQVTALILAEATVNATRGKQTKAFSETETSDGTDKYTLKEYADGTDTGTGITNASWSELTNNNAYKNLKSRWASDSNTDSDVSDDIKNTTSGSTKSYEAPKSNDIVMLSAVTKANLKSIYDQVKTDNTDDTSTGWNLQINYGIFDGLNFGGGAPAEKTAKINAVKTEINRLASADNHVITWQPDYHNSSLGERLRVRYQAFGDADGEAISRNGTTLSRRTKSGKKSKIGRKKASSKIKTSANIKRNTPSFITDNSSLFGNESRLDAIKPPKNLNIVIDGQEISINHLLNEAHRSITDPTPTRLRELKKYKKFYETLGDKNVQYFLKDLKTNTEIHPFLGNETGVFRSAKNKMGLLSLAFLESVKKSGKKVKLGLKPASFSKEFFQEPEETPTTLLGRVTGFFSKWTNNTINAVQGSEFMDSLYLTTAEREIIDTDGDNDQRRCYTFAEATYQLENYNFS
jgi:hypothetical protein